MIMFTLMMPTLLVPVVGLAIDSTMMYNVKAKLQAAVDGGAIAAAHSLNAGLTLAAQTSAAQLAADEFIRANFVPKGAVAGYSGFWRAYNLNDTTCSGSTSNYAGNPTGTGSPLTYGAADTCIVIAQDTQTQQRTVSISASVEMPMTFMWLLGHSTATVTARGTASRRNVVLVLVLDRSSSMVDTIPTLRSAASTFFVDKFQSGVDMLGLVVFGGSAMVAFPTADANPGAGALVGPQTSFLTANPNMDTLINDTVSASNTGTAEALALAYNELKAANQPGAMNVIVLFTDGQPNGVTANFNGANPSGNYPDTAATGTVVLATATSGCTYYQKRAVDANSMIGWMAQWGGYDAYGIGGSTDNDTVGIFQLSQNTGQNVATWLGNSGNEPQISSTYSGNGCNFLPTANEKKVSTAISQIPQFDYYGNSTTGTTYTIPGSGAGAYTQSDYQQSSLWLGTGMCNGSGNQANGHSWLGGVPLKLAPSGATGNTIGDACQIGLASWNASDMEAMNIHQDPNGLNPTIFTMGFEGNGGDDPAFMQRLANCKPGAPCGSIASAVNSAYWPSQPIGNYQQIATASDIGPALQKVLDEILRLSM